jgi:nitrate/nitrite transport system substrate-binding protein
MAETIADKAYVNTSVDAINQRILGRYQNGLGKTWDDPNHMKFYNDGAVNFPYLSDGMWFLTQHKRWGLLKEHPDYLAWPSRSTRSTCTSRPPPPPRTPLPKDATCAASKLMDGVVWDGKDPAKKYADGFKLKA